MALCTVLVGCLCSVLIAWLLNVLVSLFDCFVHFGVSSGSSVVTGFLCTLVGFVSQSLNSRLPSSSLWLSEYSVRQLDSSLCAMVSVDLLLCSVRVASFGCFLLAEL